MTGYLTSAGTLLLLSAAAICFIWKYPRSAHGPALLKAFFLWLFSTSPVIAGILLSRPESSNVAVSNQFQQKVLSSFSAAEMFVYASSFLAPVLYVVFDVVKLYGDGELTLKPKDLATHMRGMQGVIISSLVILALTLLAYASAKSDPTGFSQTYLGILLVDRGYILYLASLLIWYSVVLWETFPKSRFEREQREGAAEFADAYAKRRDREE